MKKAFTLIELMISILLLALIVTFLYQSVAQLQSSNQQFLQKSETTELREGVLKLLYNDLINAQDIKWNNEAGNLDTIVIHTSNSLHNMSQPHVRYHVYGDKVLRRVEFPEEKMDFINDRFRFNDMIEEVKLLRIYEHKGHYLFNLKAKGIEDIHLDIIPPAFLSEKPKEKIPSSGNDNNATKEGEA